jgi:FkbM family methyltransferase
MREAAGPLVDLVRFHYLLRPVAKLRLAADPESAAALVRLAAESPRLRRRKPELATRTVSIRLRDLGGNRVVLRPATTDYDVLLDTFLARYHLEPVRGTPGRILDLGANIGLTMAHYAQLFPAAQIVGVELDDRNVALCRDNIAPYGARCTVLRGAVWTEDGEVTYRRTGGNEWGFAVGDGTSGEEVAAPAMTVDTVLRRSGWDWVDFVKMDVEGVERDLLRRTDGWIDKVGRIGVEVHAPYSVQDCERDLRNFGFRTSRLTHHAAAVLGERPDRSGSAARA